MMTDGHRSIQGIGRMLAEIAIAAIVVVDAVEAARSLRRRMRRNVDAWWSGIDRREERQLHEDEVALLARALRRG